VAETASLSSKGRAVARPTTPEIHFQGVHPTDALYFLGKGGGECERRQEQDTPAKSSRGVQGVYITGTPAIVPPATRH